MSEIRRVRSGLHFCGYKECAIVFAVVMGISLIWDICRGRLQHTPAFEEAAIAVHLLHGDGFASPFDLSQGAPPTSYCPPIYSLIIAGVCLISRGNARCISLLLLLLNTACFGAIAVALYRLARQYLNRSAGFVAIVLLLLHPPTVFYSGYYWDTFLAIAIFFSIVAAVARLSDSPAPISRYTLVGLEMGALSLTNPSFALAYPFLLFVSTRREDSLRRRIERIGAATAVWVLVLLPWTIRDYRVFHRIYYVRDEINHQFSFGNPANATGWMEASLADASPWFNADERAMILRMGEPAYFDLCHQRFLAEYRDDPQAFWKRVVRRIGYVFISDPTQAQLQFPLLADVRWHGIYIDRFLLHSLIAVGGVAGFWTSWRLRLGCAWTFIAGLATQLPYMLTTVDDRYTLPFRAVLIFFCAMLCYASWFRSTRGHWPAANITRPIS